jgi:D-sedoheptulose 7-phosphate isomerase
VLYKIQKEMTAYQDTIQRSISTIQNHIYTASVIVNESTKSDNTIFLFGNGGSFLSAQYLAFKLIWQNKKAFVLAQDSAVLTCDANNYGYDFIFEREIELMAKEGDLLIGYSTSGNSKNVLRALSKGRNMGYKTIGFSGYDGGAMQDFCDINLVVPSSDISKIEATHIVIGGIIAQLLTS